MDRFFIVCVICILACLPVEADAVLRVVATTSDLASIAEEIGGERVSAVSLTRGASDPHYAVAKPSMIRNVYKADLLLLIGADMEIGWLPPLIQSARNSKVQPGAIGYLDLSGAIPLLGKPDGPVNRAMGDVHAKGNPHYWLDPRNGLIIAETIADRLGKLDPENAGYFKERLGAFIQKLDSKIDEWTRALDALRGKPVIAYHKSFLYLEQAFGFEIIGEVEPKPGIAPGASHLNKLVALIKESDVELLIMEPFYERRSSRYLGERTGIKVAVLPQSVGAQDGVDNYFELFDAIVAALLQPGGLK